MEQLTTEPHGTMDVVDDVPGYGTPTSLRDERTADGVEDAVDDSVPDYGMPETTQQEQLGLADRLQRWLRTTDLYPQMDKRVFGALVGRLATMTDDRLDLVAILSADQDRSVGRSASSYSHDPYLDALTAARAEAERVGRIGVYETAGRQARNAAATSPVVRARGIADERWYPGEAYDVIEAAAGALVMRDLIDSGHYHLLTNPLAQVIGPIHPEDEPVDIIEPSDMRGEPADSVVY